MTGPDSSPSDPAVAGSAGSGKREAGSGKREAGSRLSRWGGGLLLILIFGAGILRATEYELSVSLDRIAHSPHPGLAYQPSHERTQGPELVLLFAGSSTCGYSNDPDLPEVIEALKLELAAHAEEQGASFRAVGVAVDWIPEAGLEHLATFGAFDELSVGSNWTNHTLVRHTWDQGHTPATPAVFIIERTLVAEDGPGGLVRWAIDDTRVLLWRSGIHEIRTLTALPVSRYLGEFGAAGDADQGSEDLRPNSEGALPGGDP